MIKWLVIIGTIAVGFGIAAWDHYAPPPGSLRDDTVVRPSEKPVLKNAPSVIFDLADDVRMPLKDLRGKIVLVNVWATWCAPCVIEIPQLLTIAREHDDVELILLSVDQSRTIVDDFFARTTARVQNDLARDNVYVAFDPYKAVSREGFDTSLYPETYIINREGKIKHKISGLVDWLEPHVQSMIFDE